MVINTESYVQLIQYLTEHLGIFESSSAADSGEQTVIEVIEQQLSAQIIAVCSQNTNLTFNQRNIIVRDVDAIVSDLEEVFSGVVDKPATSEQILFINEFAGIIKNIFDSEIQKIALL